MRIYNEGVMARPKSVEYNLVERIEKLKEAGFKFHKEINQEEADPLDSLSERIKKILGILQDKPIKSTTMNYFIMYDIENNKVRTLVANYLLSKGCIRVQKSVYLCHSNFQKFNEIKKTLAEINEVYDNKDSIILIPINISDARSMKLIGQNVNIDQIVDPPNTVFI